MRQTHKAQTWRTCTKFTCVQNLTVLVLCVAVVSNEFVVNAQSDSQGADGNKCYDELGNPQKCTPEFVNAAFSVVVEVTNTCGESGPTEYCIQTGASARKSCEVCRADVSSLAHPPQFLTDFNNNDDQTWWQSETMYEGIQYPQQVNLTLRLRKQFDITYVRLKFHSPRPESFAIYKRTEEKGPWEPYQYYSATCRDTYGLPDDVYLRRGEETRALCTSEHSDISPLTGANVAFSTLEGRPSAYNFENSAELQDWVTATDIRITLDRLNTFGDEVFGDPKVLRSYFYAISDFAVGGRCKCNGHASECVSSTSEYGDPRQVCRCKHNTDGANCEECLPFYNDAPWRIAKSDDAYECKPCNCNGFSNRCFFDQQLFEQTGHGGHCLDCTGSRDGPNCERCKENFYQREDGICIPCNCDSVGSRSLQCSIGGKCQCKPGVGGEKCDHCEANHYDFGPQGCSPCGCIVAGSYRNQPNCDTQSGICQCKENVEGQRCDRCKPGFFNLHIDSEFGCTPCFCYGHSSVCRSAPGYSKSTIESVFSRGSEQWTAEERLLNVPLQYDAVNAKIGVQAEGREAVYFLAPARFLGDQRASYNQELVFTLSIGEDGPRTSIDDLIIEGSGLTISQPIFGQGNPLPSIQAHAYRFRLHEHPDYGWSPRLQARDFISVISHLTSIKIRGTYTPQGVGHLDDVRLGSAHRGGIGGIATWIEMCTCPKGYVGQYCESCAPGYKHEPSGGGPFAQCIPCNCHGHADICDADTGRCICQHNTAGDNCERCARGYYGNALAGTAKDCTTCPCPDQGACMQLADETVVCLECPEGYAGPRCNLCSDGFFGDPAGRLGHAQACQPCDCNGNIDSNAVGNCNRTTGECLKCIHNTGGPYCDQCLPGFYGDALALPKGNCKSCECYGPGTMQTEFGPPLCDQLDGQCQCKTYVTGKNCDECEVGFYNIDSGEGCEGCNCDPVGALNHSCEIRTGQCFCRKGVIGLRCDACAAYQYGFSDEGCKPCECDPIGSVSLQCDPSGQCPCRENVEGKQCDRCKENKYNREAGCVNCPPCYNLVQVAVNSHRSKLAELRELLDNIASNPTVIEDLDFDKKLKEVMDQVDQLWEDAKVAAGGEDKSLAERLQDLHNRLEEVQEVAGQITEKAGESSVAAGEGERNVTEAEKTIEKAREALMNAQRYLEAEGADALQRAIERSEKFGQQSERMSEIARESRELATSQTEEAEDIEEVAENALEVSTEAFELAQDAINQQKNTSDKIRLLRGDVNDMEDLLDETKQKAEETQQKAEDVYNDALNIYRDAYSLTLPDVNASELKLDAQDVEQQARSIKEEAEALKTNNADLLDNIEEQSEEAADLLKWGLEQQQIADEMLSDVDAALAKAEEAVALGDKTLEEAQKTYETLQGFDNLVQSSKDKGNKALEKVPEIRQLIEEAEEKTQDAKDALAGAEQDALEARDIAQEAQSIAEMASDNADEIRKDAAATKDKASDLQDEAVTLTGQVAETGNRLKDFEDQADEDKELAQEALKKADQAKYNAEDASRRVKDALDGVNYILYSLKNLEEIDTAQLDELEKQLSAAEQKFMDAGLDRKMEELQVARNQQKQWVRDYEDELDKLRKEVNNIEDISNALPDGCWKRLKLEP